MSKFMHESNKYHKQNKCCIKQEIKISNLHNNTYLFLDF